MNNLYEFFSKVNNVIWGEYFGIPLLILAGFYFTFQAKALQIRYFPRVLRNFLAYASCKDQVCDEKEEVKGLNPIKVFFASIGGCIGIGNIVGICEALKFGGPGALFWIWVTGFLGMIVKYSEIYLGMKFRVANKQGSYDGGPMFYLPHAFSSDFLKRWVARLVCVLICIYGIEIYMFSVMTTSISENWHINKVLVALILVAMVYFTMKGGMQRVANIAAAIIPFFIFLFSMMALWVIWKNTHMIPEIFTEVFTSAFTGHAATGGFIGATLAQTISYGIKRSCYSGDVGIGYASMMHSESKETDPARQASLGIFGIFLDTFVICSLSIAVVLFTETWKEPIDATFYLQFALEKYYNGVGIIWPVFVFLLGFSTIIAFFMAGIKASGFLFGERGKKVYLYLGLVLFFLFAFLESKHALLIMELAGGLLLTINLVGFYLLRKEIEFKVPKFF